MTSIKNLTLALTGLIFFVLSFSSCKKELPPAPEGTGTTVDLKVADNFDWKTSREITLTVVGMKDVNPNIKNTLYVNSKTTGVTYYKDMLVMNTNYTITFAVPSTETSVVLNYGSKTSTIELTSNSITFDYITQ